MFNTGSQDKLITYQYDALSNVISTTATCPSTCTQTTLEERTVYDTVGRPTQQIVENGATDLVTVTRYDQAGNPVAVTDPRGTANPAAPLAAYTTTTRYDVLGRPHERVEPAVQTDTITGSGGGGGGSPMVTTLVSKGFDSGVAGFVSAANVTLAHTTAQARTGAGSLQATLTGGLVGVL